MMNDELIRRHFNKPQLMAMLIDANIQCHIWARGVGKTSGGIAPASERRIFGLPRSSGIFVGRTYQQLLTRTLPPVIMGWERMGLKRDQDFFFGRFGPKSWERPYFTPLDPKHFIHFRNGSGITLISQDIPGSSNGISSDWMVVDEAKLIKKQQLDDETIPTLRGSASGPNRLKFEGSPLYKSQLYFTDMPTSSSSNWLFKFEQLMESGQIDLILHYQAKLQELRISMGEAPTDAKARNAFQEIQRLTKRMNQVRGRAVHYSEASALDNIEILGEEYIRQMEQTLTRLLFKTSVLNLRLRKVENGFYSDLKPDHHSYDAYDNTYLESLGLDLDQIQEMDCRQDGDLDVDQPIEAACDWGSRINVVVSGQRQMIEKAQHPKDEGDQFRILSGFHVKAPEKVRDLASKWCIYYKHHRNKTLNFYFDQTATGGHGAADETYVEQWISTCRSYGWNVNEIYLGKVPGYAARFNLISDLLKEQRKDLPKLRYNKHNCQSLEISLENAPIEETSAGIRKVKTSERDPNVLDEHATDYSDAFDSLLFGFLKYSAASSSSIHPSLSV